MEKTISSPESTAAKARAAFQYILILLLPGVVLAFFAYIYLGFQTHIWQLFASAGICMLLIITASTAILLVRRENAVAGMRLMIGTLLVVPSLEGLLIANNVGTMISIIIFIINLLLVVRTLPQKDLSRFIFWGLVAIGVAALIDATAPATQLSVPIAGTITLIAGSVMVLINIILIIRGFQSIPLGSKLLITFLLIAIIPFLTLSFLLIGVTSQSLRDTVGNNLKTLSSSQASQVGVLLANEEESLRLLTINQVINQQVESIDRAYSGGDVATIQADLKQQEAQWKNLPDNAPQVKQILDHPIAQELNDHLSTISRNLDLLVTDKYGAVIAATRRPLNYDVADQEWWKAALDGGAEDVFVSQPVSGHAGEPWSIFVSVPIVSVKTKEVIGVLRASYSMEVFIEILKQETGTRVGADLLLQNGQVYRVEGDIVSFDTDTRANLDKTADDVYGQFFYDEGPSLVSQSKVTSADPDLAPALEHLNWRVIHDQSTAEALQTVKTVTQLGVFTGLAVLLLTTFIALALSRWISLPILQLTETAQKIADGDLNAETSVTAKDEIGTLSTTFNQMTRQLRQTLAEVQQQALALQETSAAAEAANRNLAAQMWQTTGLAELNDKMRGEQDVTMLAPSVIQHLCKYLDIYSGAIYVLEDKTLQLKGAYARVQKSFAQQYQIGEELVGQAALEKNTILHELPDEYITLSLSQEKVLPKFRLIAPVVYNQQVNGVIAFEAMREFTPAQKRFIEEAIENVAITFITAQARTRVNELFTQTRQQAEELQAQEEELRATNEELEAQTDSLRTSETRLRSNQTALETANAELEENTLALREKQATLDQQNQSLRNAQQALEHKAEELTITNKYKSEFLANMSHELRTPLNSLLILSKILAKNEQGNLTSNQTESAQIIYASGSDLLQLINDILDLSKVEAGHMTFHFAPMLLKEFAQNMQAQFEHVTQQKELGFEITLAAELPEKIVTDQQRVEQVIKNLLSNAIKFTEAGTIKLAIEPAEEMIAIHVRDSGIGMTPEQQQRVFEAFQQADGSTSRKYGGTGLGLTISREMTSKLGGRIGVESELGTGSVFTLYLPLTPPAEESPSTPQPVPVSVAVTPAKAESAPPPVKIQHSPRHIPTLNDDRNNIQRGDRVLLVIEDDDTFAKVLLDYAHKKNFKCLLAHDGESGLKLAEQQTPDAILLDLKLPGMSGWDVLDTLKGEAGLRHIPVHILSASDHSIDAYKRGALGFLSKPVAQEQLDEVFSHIGEFISREIKSLLIVEDDNGLRHSVGQLLGGNDVQISEAASGQIALTLMREAHFDCIILDLSLPDMSGFELLSKISQDEKILKCPIIVYTGQALSEDENAELLKYASSVIIKGVKSPERLLDETALFLHRVVADMPTEKQNTIRLLHDRDTVFSGKHILVVDDNMRNAFALSSLLIDKNLQVTVARSGMKALEMLETVPEIDLVLMDIMMPGMDGYETMQRVRAQPKFKNLPILALTAKAMKGDMEKCIAAGANDYLSKPIDNDRLFSMLRVWLYR